MAIALNGHCHAESLFGSACCMNIGCRALMPGVPDDYRLNDGESLKDRGVGLTFYHVERVCLLEPG